VLTIRDSAASVRFLFQPLILNLSLTLLVLYAFLPEVNSMEHELLVLLDWETHVTEEDIFTYLSPFFHSRFRCFRSVPVPTAYPQSFVDAPGPVCVHGWGARTLPEVNSMEHELLVLLDWETHVTEEDIFTYLSPCADHSRFRCFRSVPVPTAYPQSFVDAPGPVCVHGVHYGEKLRGVWLLPARGELDGARVARFARLGDSGREKPNPS
jgi:hypothetical protein